MDSIKEKANNESFLLNAVKKIVFVIFALCFSVQMYKITAHYIEKKTFWTSEEKRFQSLDFPGLTFCSRQIYKNQSLRWITKQDFRRNMFKPEDFFHPETLAQFNNKTVDLQVKETLSLFFGMCYTVTR